MKFILLLSVFLSVQAFAAEQVMGITLGDTARVAPGMSLKKIENGLSFYQVSYKKKFYGIQPSELTYIVGNGKWVGALIEFQGENNFQTIKTQMMAHFGQPSAQMQKDSNITVRWAHRVLNFDAYEQMGVMVWTQ